mmetsp:Transcript_23978/g.48756  ORF Transcript_23978/g.48756 Transcript_23978/m.48756 type:complete len:202 (-) Transcript_23978:112-717(-)
MNVGSSGQSREHLASKLSRLVFSVQSLYDLERELKAGPRALAGDDVPVHHRLGVLPRRGARHRLLERGRRVAGCRSWQQAVRPEYHRRRSTDSSGELARSRLVQQQLLEGGGVAQALCSRHAAWQGYCVPLLSAALLNPTIRHDIQSTGHTNPKLWLNGRDDHLGASAYKCVSNTRGFYLLAVLCYWHQHSQRLAGGHEVT